MATAVWNTDPDLEPERRILVIGKTGEGKSATANTLLGRDVFKSKFGPESETSTCGYEKTERFGRKLVVVDTPGIFDTRHADYEIEKEVIRSCLLLSPGIHAILLVLKAGNRYTKEERDAVEKYRKLFGEEVSNYMFLILSHWDFAMQEGKSLDDYFSIGGEQFNQLKHMCKGGIYTINNKDKANSDQVEQLLNGIDANLERMKILYFTNVIFEDIEIIFPIIIEPDSEANKGSDDGGFYDVVPKRDLIRRRIADEPNEKKGIFLRLRRWFRRMFRGRLD